MQQLDVKVIPLKDQRYATLGDYWEDDKGNLYFRITETGNDLHNKVILVHELIEQLLTQAQGIKEEDILSFDLWVENEVKEGRYSEENEPGEHPLSPYKKQHDFAMNVERQIMNFLNIDFKTYDKQVMSTFEK